MNDKIRLKQTFFDKSPSDWKIIKILDFCDFERGTEPGSKSYNREGKGAPFIRVGNIAAQIQEQIYTTSKNIKLCDENDILIALDGSPGVVVRGFKGAHSSGIRKVIVKQPDKLLKDFVYFVLQADSIQKIIEKYATGMTIKHASKSLEHLEIPLPPLPEQQKIVYVLDSIQDAIRVQEKIIEKTKELKKSMMADLFKYGGPSFRKGRKLNKTEIGEIPENWEIVKLGNKKFFEIKGGKRLPKNHNFVENKTSYLYIRVVDFKNNSVDISNLKYLSYQDYEILKKYFITKNDIYISIAGTIGLVGLIPNELDGAILTENAAKIIIKNKDLIDKRFLVVFLSFSRGQYQIKTLTSKSTQPKLGLYRIEQIQIPLPPLPEQREIADILQTIDQKIEIEQKKKTLYEELFKTMLNKLMTGEIRVDNLKL